MGSWGREANLDLCLLVHSTAPGSLYACLYISISWLSVGCLDSTWQLNRGLPQQKAIRGASTPWTEGSVLYKCCRPPGTQQHACLELSEGWASYAQATGTGRAMLTPQGQGEGLPNRSFAASTLATTPHAGKKGKKMCSFLIPGSPSRVTKATKDCKKDK